MSEVRSKLPAWAPPTCSLPGSLGAGPVLAVCHMRGPYSPLGAGHPDLRQPEAGETGPVCAEPGLPGRNPAEGVSPGSPREGRTSGAARKEGALCGGRSANSWTLGISPHPMGVPGASDWSPCGSVGVLVGLCRGLPEVCTACCGRHRHSSLRVNDSGPQATRTLLCDGWVEVSPKPGIDGL